MEYHVVHLHNGAKAIPRSDDPLASLRAEFADSDKSPSELRRGALDAALADAGK